MVVYCLDISNWQGDVNMSTWKAMNVRGCFAKALEGMTGVDKKWYSNKSKLASLAGNDFVPGAYHYANNVHSATDQCKAFLDLVPGDWMHGFDVEAPGPIDVNGWFNEYRRHYPDKVVALYTNAPMWKNRSLIPLMDVPARYGPVEIWVAGAYLGAYQAGTDDFRKIWSRVPAGADGGLPFLGFDQYTIMQYSGSATVPGVPGTGNCDAGVAGSIEDLKRLASVNGGKDMPLTNDDINKVVAALKPIIHDEVRNAFSDDWVNADALLPPGSKDTDQLSPLAMILQAYVKTNAMEQRIANQTDTVESTLTKLQGNDTTLQAAVDALNAKIGTGEAGQLSKQDVVDALQGVIGSTKFVPETPSGQ